MSSLLRALESAALLLTPLPSGRDRRRAVGQLEVHERGLDDERVGEEGEDSHLSTAARA